jgi:hypothetical protein
MRALRGMRLVPGTDSRRHPRLRSRARRSSLGNGRNGNAPWAYRRRVNGCGSTWPQVGDSSPAEAQEALRRTLDQLRNAHAW